MAYEFLKQLTEGKIHNHLDFQGMNISIEIPAGGKRTGTNKKSGEKWEQKVDDAYGYIKGTHSPDGEHLDCYVRKNPNKDAKVYVMHQLTVDGTKFDEDKVMLGYDSKAQAVKAFKKFTFKPDVMFGGVTEFNLEHFRVVAYQASNSHAMLTDEDTFEDFKKRGLIGRGIVSPLTVARRVCEGKEMKYQVPSVHEIKAMLEALENASVEETLFSTNDGSKKFKGRNGLVGWGFGYWHDEDCAGPGDAGGGDGGMGESAGGDDHALSYHLRNKNLDDRYVDKFAGTEMPACTCDEMQLAQVGCGCDQESWQYAQTVLDFRAKHPEHFQSQEVGNQK